MGVVLEGVGDDWLVTRRPGEGVRLHTFSDPKDIPAIFRQLLAEKGEHPTRRPPRAEPLKLETLSAPAILPPQAPLRVNGNGLYPKPVAQEIPECMDCGACCSPPDGSARSYVGLELADVDRLPIAERPRLVVTGEGKLPGLATRKSGSGRRVCAAFLGELGGKCSCSIYDSRPDACRTFKRGSEDCLRARSLVGVGQGV